MSFRSSVAVEIGVLISQQFTNNNLHFTTIHEQQFTFYNNSRTTIYISQQFTNNNLYFTKILENNLHFATIHEQ